MTDETETLHHTPNHCSKRYPFSSAAPREDTTQAPIPITDETAGDQDEVWSGLVNRVKAGDRSAMAELYLILFERIRFSLCQHGHAQDLDDRIHDAFLIAVQSIQRGHLRDPRCLIAFVRTIGRRAVSLGIRRTVRAREDSLDVAFGAISDLRADPEKSLMLRQNAELLRQTLDSMSSRDREVLFRFYVEEQSQVRICDEMRLSLTQFRLLKNRAKARFGDRGRTVLRPHP
jgi:RNA polymerase sigma-70 factor (ECF subfamily)